MHLIQNLKHLRKLKGFTQEDLAGELKIPRPTLAGWERGSAEPSLKSLNRLCRIFSVSLDNLVLDNLTEGGREVSVDEQFRVLAITVDPENRELVDLVPTKAEAGYLEHFSNPDFVGELPKVTIPNIPEGSYRAFEIRGESMLPMQPGSIVVGGYVERLSDIHSGKTYVVVTGDGIVYKRLRTVDNENRLIAISDNPVYPPYEINYSDILEVWSYHCHISWNDSVDDSNSDLQIRLIRLEDELKVIRDLVAG